MNNPILPNPPANGEFIQTNDPLALAALILAELERPGRTIIELGAGARGQGPGGSRLWPTPDPRYPTPCSLLTPGQALAIARRACRSILCYGQPAPGVPSGPDLVQAIAILDQMLATLELASTGTHPEGSDGH